MASLKAPLLRQKPCSSTGRVEIQDDAPVSLAHSSNLRAAGFSWSLTLFASSVCLSFLPCFSHCSLGQVVCCRVRCEGAFLCNDGIFQGGCYLFGCFILMVAHCDWVHKTHSPSLAGRASSALSTSEQGDRPVSAGMNFWWMTSSRG